MLARAPHSLRAQVARARVAPSARFVHGHGEYHVRVLCLPPVQHHRSIPPLALAIRVAWKETIIVRYQGHHFLGNRIQHSFRSCQISIVRSYSIPSVKPHSDSC
jgi:hypothetical protein